jgi:hypothetical protein
MTDRHARYEARRREKGGRTIVVRMDPEAVAALDCLIAVHGSVSAAVRAALLQSSPTSIHASDGSIRYVMEPDTHDEAPS